MTDEIEVIEDTPPKVYQLIIRADDPDRVQDLVTVDELVGLESGRFTAMRNVLAKFVIDPDTGEYMEYEDGLAEVGRLSLRKLIETTERFKVEVQDALVPPKKGRGSTKRSQ